MRDPIESRPRNQALEITRAFYRGEMDLSARAKAPKPGRASMPECLGVASVQARGAPVPDARLGARPRPRREPAVGCCCAAKLADYLDSTVSLKILAHRDFTVGAIVAPDGRAIYGLGSAVFPGSPPL